MQGNEQRVFAEDLAEQRPLTVTALRFRACAAPT